MITIITFQNPQIITDKIADIHRIESMKVGVRMVKTVLFFKNEDSQKKAISKLEASEIVRGISVDDENIQIINSSSTQNLFKQERTPRRRDNLDLNHHIELSIKNIIEEIENVNGNSSMADAASMLQEALTFVSDYFDTINFKNDDDQ